MSASWSALGEAAFAALPKTLRAKIDDAFTSISLSNPPHRQTHSSLAPAAPALGGGGGGFILEDTVAEPEAQGATTTNASARIPLASIPAALALLDLPPHDRQILAVFRDAAESESEDEDNAAEYGANGANNGNETSVSRSQWRAVCAVLLEGSSPSPSPSSPSSPSPSSPSSPSSHPSPSSTPRQREERKTRPRRSKAAYTPISAYRADADADGSGDDSEPYVASDDSDHSLQQGKDQYDDDEEEDGDDSDYEYTSKPSKSTKSTNKSKSRSKANANANANAPPDHAAALAAFALFFPSFPSTPAHDPTPRDPTPRDPTELKEIPTELKDNPNELKDNPTEFKDNSNELKDKKITLRDLQAAMKRAGEKYKADDLTEMLALFSTSPDTSNSLSFADFGRIMRAAGLA